MNSSNKILGRNSRIVKRLDRDDKEYGYIHLFYEGINEIILIPFCWLMTIVNVILAGIFVLYFCIEDFFKILGGWKMSNKENKGKKEDKTSLGDIVKMVVILIVVLLFLSGLIALWYFHNGGI